LLDVDDDRESEEVFIAAMVFFSGRAERGGLESLAKAEAAVAANWEREACARGEGATVLLL
jgi:hypothetical protein